MPSKPLTSSRLPDLARAWLAIGTQSVGGGASTVYLMRREFVEKRGWLTHREFLEEWALAKLSLGINLIALTGMIGARAAGLRGVVVSVLALLVPSGAITALMTAGYVYVEDNTFVRSALSGAAPVIAGMTVAIAFTFARQSVRRGRHAVLDWTWNLIAIAAGLLTGLSPVAVIAAGILVGLVFLRGEGTRAAADPGA